MIELRIQEVAKERGILTIKGLADRAALAYDTAADLWHGRMKRLDLEVLNRVCMALDCVPSDLLSFRRDEEEGPESWQTLRAAA
ncbi:MAG: helix-turn-helix domain-containing protein [Oscillochloridaceae bacterium umkhey_bin13]